MYTDELKRYDHMKWITGAKSWGGGGVSTNRPLRRDKPWSDNMVGMVAGWNYYRAPSEVVWGPSPASGTCAVTLIWRIKSMKGSSGNNVSTHQCNVIIQTIVESETGSDE